MLSQKRRWRFQITSIAYTTNALDQYVTVGAAALHYDTNGNETTDQRGHSYTYDAENVLRTATGVTYQYYGDGTRRQKNVGGVITQYLYSATQNFLPKRGEQVATDQEIGEYDSGGALLRRYVRLPGSTDEPFLMIDMTQAANDRERWVHQNRQGSVVALTNISGAVTNQFRYDPYGRVGTEGASGFPFRYTGQRIDPETGLYYYKARYYDPDTGRFLQTDAIGYKDDLNLYTYVRDDPLGGRDPSGQLVCSASDARCQVVIKDANIAIAQLHQAQQRLGALRQSIRTGRWTNETRAARSAFEQVYGRGSATAANVGRVAGVAGRAADYLLDPAVRV